MHVKLLFGWNRHKSKKKEIFTWTSSCHMNLWPSTSMSWYRLSVGHAACSKASWFLIRHLVKPMLQKPWKTNAFSPVYSQADHKDAQALSESCQAIFLWLSDHRALTIFKAPWGTWKSQGFKVFLYVLERDWDWSFQVLPTPGVKRKVFSWPDNIPRISGVPDLTLSSYRV